MPNAHQADLIKSHKAGYNQTGQHTITLQYKGQCDSSEVFFKGTVATQLLKLYNARCCSASKSIVLKTALPVSL